MNILKIPSGEITNLPYLRKLGALSKQLILSTGMADLGEIEDALGVLTDSGTPLENITVLHCNTEYSTPFEDVNLRAMQTIAHAFGVAIGYSDHSLGIEVAVADLRSKFPTAKFAKTRDLPKAFTEKGLYLIATIRQ